MTESERKIDMERQLKVKASMISGMITGAIYKSILHPIDTIKVRILVRICHRIRALGARNIP